MPAKMPPDITDPDFLTFMAHCPFRWQGDTGTINWLTQLYEWGYDDGAGSGVPAPPPVLSSTTPTVANVGDASFPLMAQGSDFQTGAVVVFGGVDLPTVSNGPTQATGQVDAALLNNAQAVNVSVRNPDSQISGNLPFTIL